MHRLAKLGFSQSYTYFTWRNSSYELREYFTELSQDPSREYFRPNVWPNTPDILHEYLQEGARPAFVNRLVLAATLASNYGVYGPAFELWEHEPREPGSEEYRDSEKYQQRLWDLDRPDSLRLLMARVNRIRRENPALHHDWSLRFHAVDNPMLLCYSKMTPDRSNVILTIASTDWRWPQSGFVDLDLGALGVDDGEPFIVEDLLYGGTYTWQGARNFVGLQPGGTAAHVLRVERRGR
jgi:starch synthase (maltosyl-transferring)